MNARFLGREDLQRGAAKAALAQLNLFYDVEAKRQPGHELGNVTRLYACAVAERREKAFVQRHKLKRAGGICCPRRLLGKRCGQNYPKNNFRCDEHSPPSIDHAQLWNRDGKPFMVTWHPYGLGYKTIKALVEYCERHGFQFDVDGESFYFPDVTPMVMLWRAGENL